MKIRHAVVPVAGLGTRLLPITAAVPKEMLPLGRKPTLQYVAEEVSRANLDNMVLVTSEEKLAIENYFRTNPELESRLKDSGKSELLESLWSHSPHAKLKFHSTIQQQQNGLGHAVLCAAKLVLSDSSATHFVVALGDCVLGLNGSSNILKRLVAAAESENADVAIAFEQVPDEKVSRFGIANPKNEPGSNGIFELKDVVEKPSPKDAPSNLAIAARYVLSTDIFEVLRTQAPGRAGEIQLTDAIRTLISNGGKAIGIRLDAAEQRYDVGNLASYTEAFIQFALADTELAKSVRNAVESVSIKP